MPLLDTDIMIDVLRGYVPQLIGQTSIELNMPLHTFNEKHYRMIPGLQTIQPYVKS